MEVLSVSEMNYLDKYTCTATGMTPLDLMECTGKQISRCLIDECHLKKSHKLLIVSGIGNNGGDSLVVARILIESGYNVQVVLVGDRDKLSDCTKINLDKLIRQNEKTILSNTVGERLKDVASKADIILEGIFGIGLNRRVEGVFYEAIQAINDSPAKVVSIDIPSGINGDNGNIYGISVKADCTIVIQYYKSGNLLNDAKDYQGRCKVVDIGLIHDIISPQKYLLSSENLHLNLRKNNTHKYNYGSMLTVGGSLGMTGAPLLCAYAGLRSGVGLSTIAIKRDYAAYINNIYPEIMVKPYDKSNFKDILLKKDIIAFGPGLGRDDDYLPILEDIMEEEVPVLVDADGLYFLKQYLKNNVDMSNIVITPHNGEMAQLLNISTDEVSQRPIESVKRLTESYGINVVLKGPSTIIANSDEIHFSPYGNPGMATAGSGDVLSGVIASMIGQGYKPIDACKLGVYIHSKSGEKAAERFGQYSIIASDIVDYMPNVIKSLL